MNDRLSAVSRVPRAIANASQRVKAIQGTRYAVRYAKMGKVREMGLRAGGTLMRRSQGWESYFFKSNSWKSRY